MRQTVASSSSLPVPEIKKVLRNEAIRIAEEDIETNRRMGEWGKTVIQNGETILTYCNAGALATAGWGTALGVLYSARESGKKFEVIACETRPFLQGARLTSWELTKNGIPVTLITDNMVASLMRQGKIQKIVVGADRIAANGDTANKIGTYGVASLAKMHHIPFYVAAPFSTIDFSCADGNTIPIEERGAEEVTNFYRQRIAPEGITVRNPAFDVTPHELISGIITEKGIVVEPYVENLRKLYEKNG